MQVDTGCGCSGLSLQFLGQPLGAALASPGRQGLGKVAGACPRPHCGGSLTPLREVRVLGLQGTPLTRLSHSGLLASLLWSLSQGLSSLPKLWGWHW